MSAFSSRPPPVPTTMPSSTVTRPVCDSAMLASLTVHARRYADVRLYATSARTHSLSLGLRIRGRQEPLEQLVAQQASSRREPKHSPGALKQPVFCELVDQ